MVTLNAIEATPAGPGPSFTSPRRQSLQSTLSADCPCMRMRKASNPFSSTYALNGDRLGPPVILTLSEVDLHVVCRVQVSPHPAIGEPRAVFRLIISAQHGLMLS